MPVSANSATTHTHHQTWCSSAVRSKRCACGTLQVQAKERSAPHTTSSRPDVAAAAAPTDDDETKTNEAARHSHFISARALHSSSLGRRIARFASTIPFLVWIATHAHHVAYYYHYSLTSARRLPLFHQQSLPRKLN